MGLRGDQYTLIPLFRVEDEDAWKKLDANIGTVNDVPYIESWAIDHGRFVSLRHIAVPGTISSARYSRAQVSTLGVNLPEQPQRSGVMIRQRHSLKNRFSRAQSG